ncbi:MAG TPA: 2-oxo-4-hydroxy-4-carboxy-5-ureidoimidazoline decarboxylase [Actinomycetes bacterium]|nr:2-oxo-4-hydroxy-4-carboxy-5-ureidoimidazoline decarboxylase [Actinomycetes bacterium]
MTLPDDVLGELDELLAPADAALSAGWPGEPAAPQPVHTLYLPADRVDHDVLATVGTSALAAVEGIDAAAMARISGLDPALVEDVWPRVLAKLTRQPVEDLRADLEDGYGHRSDDEEDRDAAASGAVLAGLSGPSAPLVRGVRVKSLEALTRRRGVRSLDLVLAALGDGLPPGFVVTLPKVTSVDQVAAMVVLCERLEAAHGLPGGALRFEVQVETPQVVLGPDGTATVAAVVHEARGRCTGMHFGTYDYSAALGVAPDQQAMDHPVADHAKDVMQVAAAQTGVRVSDGSTNVLPVGDRGQVEAAWALHARLVRRSLSRGIYQGWDLHPAQLPTRYLATFAFFRSGLAVAIERLSAYLERRSGQVLDEPATAAALAGYVLRGLDCGAVDRAEVVAAGGPGPAELRRLARRAPSVFAPDVLSPEALRAALLGVCASRRWADLVAAAAPYHDVAGLQRAADVALGALDESDVDEALAGHPRIGERGHDPAARREQAGVDHTTRDALLAANREYETRFGHVYLVRASGRSGEELLALLRQRLRNDPAQERAVVRAELGQINALRLERLATEEAR